MVEIVRVLVRVVAVIAATAVVPSLVALRGGPPDGDFTTWMTAFLLGLATCAVWSGRDARRSSLARASARWLAVALVVGGGTGILSTALAPGSPPDERVGEALSFSTFLTLPLLAAAAVGLAVGSARRPDLS